MQIQKVVNKKLRERYAHRQKEIADENHNHHNERMLFHGKHSQEAHRCECLLSLMSSVLQVLRSSTPSSTKALMSVMLTLVGCLEQVSTLQRIHQRATSMSMASEEGLAVRRTKIGPAICATGNWTSNPSDRV